LLGLAASTHVCVCGFDFSGSGLSDGEYVSALACVHFIHERIPQISLGYHEKEDARVVFETLIFRGFQKILLWGRSMGAATALMFAGTYGDALRDVCAGLVLDSPFSSFEELALRLTQSGAIRVSV
jgi:pimeloyl-ACP methyl ester carboxylesterase